MLQFTEPEGSFLSGPADNQAGRAYDQLQQLIRDMKQTPAHIFLHPVHFLSMGFGSGLAPRAPGTFGTLAGLPVYALLSQFSTLTYAVCVFFICVVGIYFCQRTAQALGVHDHPAIVWDEIAGILIALFLLPGEWPWLIAGVLIFRIFDILKPWPIGAIDARVDGGIGIMLDDIIAGVLTLICLQLTNLII